MQYVKLLVKTLRLLHHAPTPPLSLLPVQEALEQYEEVQATTENKRVKNQPLLVGQYVKLLVKTLRLLHHAPTPPLSLLPVQEALEQYEEVQATTENKRVKNQPLLVGQYVRLLVNHHQFVDHALTQVALLFPTQMAALLLLEVAPVLLPQVGAVLLSPVL
jgi:hypothetical protein